MASASFVPTFILSPYDPLFDNVAWVQQNDAVLAPMRQDVNKTFKYVILNHPNGGCAFDMMKSMMKVDVKPWSIDQLASIADAVTVSCYEVLGDTQCTSVAGTLNDARALESQTSIGNMAFIALYHSNPDVRARLRAELERWKSGARQPSSWQCVVV